MSLLEKMLAETKDVQQSLATQINTIEEISSQSNNLLLDMEGERFNEADKKTAANMKLYKYSKEIDQIVPKAIELCQRLPNGKDESLNDSTSHQIFQGFANFLVQSQQNIQYLSNNVRKAVVITEILQKTEEMSPKCSQSVHEDH